MEPLQHALLAGTVWQPRIPTYGDPFNDSAVKSRESRLGTDLYWAGGNHFFEAPNLDRVGSLTGKGLTGNVAGNKKPDISLKIEESQAFCRVMLGPITINFEGSSLVKDALNA